MHEVLASNGSGGCLQGAVKLQTLMRLNTAVCVFMHIEL